MAELDINLATGVTYITIGTVQQIQHLFRDTEVTLKVLYEPTTDEMVRWASYYEVWSATPTVVVCYCKHLKGTTSKSKRSKPSPNDKFLIPNDEYFQVHPNVFFFVLVTDILGELSTTKSVLNKLIGNRTQLLDLKNYLEGDKFPLASRTERVSPEIICDLDYPYEHSLIASLTSLSGLKQWQSFNSNQLFRLFLNPNYKNIPLLSMAKATSLQVYLTPFINKLEQGASLTDSSAYLLQFAYWVYCSTHYWSEEYYSSGLKYVTSKSGKSKYWSFYISNKAKLKWLELITKPTLSLTQTNV